MEEDEPLADRVALISGASRGMGRELALAFARAGARGVTVTAAAASDESREEIDGELAETVSAIERAAGPGRGLGLHADVTRWEDCTAAVTRTVEAFGGLHVLVNNAGKSQRYHGARGIPFWETDPEGWRLVIDTNVVGPYLMAKAAVPRMLKAGSGRVINTSKSPDSMHEAHTGAYGPSKAALEAESISWAEELADTGVTVNCLSPGGAVNTKFGRGMIRDRGLPPDVMVPLALWLASEASQGITGCRFNASLWDESLPPDEAAAACRTGPLFPAPKRETRLTLAWQGAVGDE